MSAAPALCLRPLRSQLIDRLMVAGTWLNREELTAGTSSSQLAIEDALADLVVEGQAEYRANVGYRLAGTELTRRAARQLKYEGGTRAVYGQQEGNEYRVGVAERVQRAGLDVVMFELAMPMPQPGPDGLELHMRQVDEILKFSTRGIEDGTSSV